MRWGDKSTLMDILAAAITVLGCAFGWLSLAVMNKGHPEAAVLPIIPMISCFGCVLTRIVAVVKRRERERRS